LLIAAFDVQDWTGRISDFIASHGNSTFKAF
jgi:hypothetical protein